MPSRKIAGIVVVILLSKERALSAEWFSILLQHVRVEEVATIAGVASTDAGTILDVLSLGVGCTELWIVGTREEMLPNVGIWVRVSTAAFLWVTPPGRGHRCSGVCLGVSVGACDDNLEIRTALTSVGGSCAIDNGSPECALIIGDGGRVGATKLG